MSCSIFIYKFTAYLKQNSATDPSGYKIKYKYFEEYLQTLYNNLFYGIRSPQSERTSEYPLPWVDILTLFLII